MYRRFYGLLTTDMGFKYIISHCIVCHFKNCSCLLCLLLRGAYGTISQSLPDLSSFFLPRYIIGSFFFLSFFPSIGFPQHFHGQFIPESIEAPSCSLIPGALKKKLFHLHTCLSLGREGTGARGWDGAGLGESSWRGTEVGAGDSPAVLWPYPVPCGSPWQSMRKRSWGEVWGIKGPGSGAEEGLQGFEVWRPPLKAKRDLGFLLGCDKGRAGPCRTPSTSVWGILSQIRAWGLLKALRWSHATWPKGCRRLRHRWSREKTSGPSLASVTEQLSQPKAGRLAGGNAAHCQLLAAPAVPTALGDTHSPTGCLSPVLAHPRPPSSSHTTLRASSFSSCTLTPKQPLGTPRSIAGGGEGR